jgi:lipopolysaccharide/colanic/teichoic acid biosynthesis glycosyltransferase
VARKVALPIVDPDKPYGMIIRLRRIGKVGELFDVFKFLTMYPYAAFLQEYVYIQYNVTNGGKLANDFCITSWNSWTRKLWLDEQPMLINWLRGEMKLVGVRPLSKEYFTLYPEEYRQRRINHAPCLIPPFYYDLPESIEEIVESEKKYLDAYNKHPR